MHAVVAELERDEPAVALDAPERERVRHGPILTGGHTRRRVVPGDRTDVGREAPPNGRFPPAVGYPQICCSTAPSKLVVGKFVWPISNHVVPRRYNVVVVSTGYGSAGRVCVQTRAAPRSVHA